MASWFRKSPEEKAMIAAEQDARASHVRLTENRNVVAGMEADLAKLAPGSVEHTKQVATLGLQKTHLETVTKNHAAVEEKLAEALKANTGGKAGKIRANYENFTKGGNITSKVWSGAKDGAGRATGGIRGGFKWVAEKASYGVTRVGKWPVAAIAAGAAYWAYSSHKRAEKASAQELDSQAYQASLPVALGGNTMMGLDPVVGQHANRVLAARGGVAAGVDPSNPALAGADNIQNLRG